MIVPMKSVAVVMSDSGRTDAVHRLGALGVLHLRERPEPGSDGELDRLESAIRILEAYPGAAPESPSSNELAPAGVAEQVLDLVRQRGELDVRVAELEREIERIAPLGEFDSDLEDLRDSGLAIRVYRCPAREFQKLAESFCCSVIHRRRSELWVAVLGRTGDETPSLPEVPLPADSPSKLRNELERARGQRRDLNPRLLALGSQLERLHEEVGRLRDRRTLREALASARSEPPVAYVTGYCPQPRVAELQRAAEAEGWALLARDVGPEDDPPTLLANRPWVDSAGPIYRMIDSVPGYREADTSLWFVIYLALFFAILIGDAGYGLLVLLGAAAWRRWGTPSVAAVRLLVMLGSATIAWGALSGNWFGLEALATAPVSSWFVIPQLNAFDPASQTTVMLVCFVIGASHLSVAHLTIAFRQRHSLSALCQVGWTLIVWGAFFVVRFLVLERPIPVLAYVFLAAGGSLAVSFAQPDRGLLGGFGIGLGRLPLKLMSCFGDLISYIRLFAVGMATLAVAASFNEIAAGFDLGNLAAVVPAALVLLLGHGINLAMAALSVVVHGVRLNMLEFSGHAELKWSGTEYHPFHLIHPNRKTFEE